MDIKRAPKSFDSRTRCTGRRYEYIMPTYVLAPKEHIATLFEEVTWARFNALEYARYMQQCSAKSIAVIGDNNGDHESLNSKGAMQATM